MIEIKGIDPKMIANNTEPFEPTHPGELLRDEIEYRHISQKQLAADIAFSRTMICRQRNMTSRLRTGSRACVNLWLHFNLA